MYTTYPWCWQSYIPNNCKVYCWYWLCYIPNICNHCTVGVDTVTFPTTLQVLCCCWHFYIPNNCAYCTVGADTVTFLTTAHNLLLLVKLLHSLKQNSDLHKINLVGYFYIYLNKSKININKFLLIFYWMIYEILRLYFVTCNGR
jgi:hypothetical protein